MVKNILVIDDEEWCLNLLLIQLEYNNFNITTANNGYEALAMLKHKTKFDLILLDVAMPDMNGIEFLEHIKSDNRLKKIKIILQTGYISQQDLDIAIKLGIDDYLVKPFSGQNLINKIKQII